MGGVSVVIPSYNGSAFIGEALESVFTQTQLPREIIVVDDASTDNTPEFVSALLARSPIAHRLIRLGQNSGGPAHPMNIGINSARGSLIAILDQDDRFVPNNLERLKNAIAMLPVGAVGLVTSDLVVFDESHKDPLTFLDQKHWFRHRFGKCSREGVICLDPAASFRAMCLAHCINHKGLYPKRVWELVGGYDTRFRAIPDLDFVWRVSRRYCVGMIDEVLLEVRRHDNSLFARDELSSPECLRYLRRMLSCAVSAEDRYSLRRRIKDELLSLAYSRRKFGNVGGAICSYTQAAINALFGSSA